MRTQMFEHPFREMDKQKLSHRASSPGKSVVPNNRHLRQLHVERQRLAGNGRPETHPLTGRRSIGIRGQRRSGSGSAW